MRASVTFKSLSLLVSAQWNSVDEDFFEFQQILSGIQWNEIIKNSIHNWKQVLMSYNNTRKEIISQKNIDPIAS